MLRFEGRPSRVFAISATFDIPKRINMRLSMNFDCINRLSTNYIKSTIYSQYNNITFNNNFSIRGKRDDAMKIILVFAIFASRDGSTASLSDINIMVSDIF